MKENGTKKYTQSNENGWHNINGWSLAENKHKVNH